jgi:hypothetical protein
VEGLIPHLVEGGGEYPYLRMRMILFYLWSMI